MLGADGGKMSKIERDAHVEEGSLESALVFFGSLIGIVVILLMSI